MYIQITFGISKKAAWRYAPTFVLIFIEMLIYARFGIGARRSTCCFELLSGLGVYVNLLQGKFSVAMS
jgi:hypothetical protein